MYSLPFKICLTWGGKKGGESRRGSKGRKNSSPKVWETG